MVLPAYLLVSLVLSHLRCSASWHLSQTCSCMC